MSKCFVLLILFVNLYGATLEAGQWKFAEHRYKYKLEDVLEADRFVEKDRYWEAYKNQDLAGYVCLSKDWTRNLVGYSGKHMETLIGMNTEGVITGVKLIFHSEPIVLIGLKDENYLKFLKQYPGKNIRKDMTVGKEISVDAITGATVTAVVQNAIVQKTAREVALRTGLMNVSKRLGRTVRQEFTPLTWKELVETSAVRNIVVPAEELGIEGPEDFLNLYFGPATIPSIGRNLLGDQVFEETLGKLAKGESAIVIFSNGNGSFKGSGFARGGIFDRFNIEQENRVYIFRDKDYRILTDIKAEGAPAIKEGGVFIVRGGDFDPARPFKFNLILSYRVQTKKEFRSFKVEYKLPDRFLE